MSAVISKRQTPDTDSVTGERLLTERLLLEVVHKNVRKNGRGFLDLLLLRRVGAATRLEQADNGWNGISVTVELIVTSHGTYIGRTVQEKTESG